MSAKKRRSDEDRSLIREALRCADGAREPGVDRLLESVPGMMAEAQRRRRLRAEAGTLAALVPLAWKLVPRLATVAAVLVLLAALLSIGNSPPSGELSVDPGTWILTGTEVSDSSDLILEAIVGQEDGNG